MPQQRFGPRLPPVKGPFDINEVRSVTINVNVEVLAGALPVVTLQIQHLVQPLRPKDLTNEIRVGLIVTFRKACILLNCPPRSLKKEI